MISLGEILQENCETIWLLLYFLFVYKKLRSPEELNNSCYRQFLAK